MKKYLKSFPKHILLAILFIASVIATSFFGEPVKIKILEFFHKKELSYEVVSVSRLTSFELQNYSKTEGISSFNLNLDDPILKNYYVIKVKLKNKRTSINGNLKLHISIGNEFVKIIDIQHKVNEPHDKMLVISHSIPHLIWSLEKPIGKQDKLRLSWKAPTQLINGTRATDTDIAGYNLYQSALKDVGYGRVNEKLIQNAFIEIEKPANDFSSVYYAFETIGSNGGHSPLSRPSPYPQLLAFQPLFKDVIFIEPKMETKHTNSGLKTTYYHSLAEAIENEKSSLIFIVNEYRDNIISLQNLVSNSVEKFNILYLEDLNFLNGKAEIYLGSGLDEGAEINFYFLCKILPVAGYDFKMILAGQPEIKFKRHNTAIKYNFAITDNGIKNDTDKKYLLTPKIVTTVLNEHAINLFWEAPKDHTYKGVKIFRSEKNADDAYSLGEEIYDGPGNSSNLHCSEIVKHGRGKAVKSKTYITPPPEPPSPEPPPQKKIEGRRPAAPTIAIFTSIVPPYFADNNVSSNSVYTYTLYAYDDKGNYSYPIVVNASLSDVEANLFCTHEEIKK